LYNSSYIVKIVGCVVNAKTMQKLSQLGIAT
jgi:hypothetical protein